MTPRWKLEQYVDKIEKDSPTTFPVNCHDTTCPEFERCCQLPSQGRMFGKDNATIVYLTGTVSPEEAELGVPAIDESGMYLRDGFIQKINQAVPRTPFIISKVLRSNVGDDEPGVRALRACWKNLGSELVRHQPRLIVVFGVGVFSSLWAHITNRSEFPPRDEHSQGTLIGQFFPVEFDNGVKTTMYVAHHPKIVIASPAMGYFMDGDRDQIVAFLDPSKSKLVAKKTLDIKSNTLLKSSAEVLDYLDFLASGFSEPKYVAFDTETFNLNKKFNNAFLTWQFCVDDGEAMVLPIEHPDLPLFKDPQKKKRLAAAAQRLFDRSREETNIMWWMVHNGKFDFGVLYGLLGVIPRTRGHVPIWDVMLAAHWLDENRKGLKTIKYPYSLKTLGSEAFGFKYKQESLDRRAEGELFELPIEDLVEYGGADAILTRALGLRQHEQADAQPDRALLALSMMMQHYYSHATRAIAMMECNGLYTNRDHIEYLQGEDSPIWGRLLELDEQLQELPDVQLFRRLYKGKIGLKDKKTEYEDSPWDDGEGELPRLDLNKQDAQKLFYLDFLQLEPFTYSDKTNEPSLNKKFLQQYANPLEFRKAFVIKENFLDRYGTPFENAKGEKVFNLNPVQIDLEYRELKKLGTTYSSGMHGMLLDSKGDCLDGRIRASYNMHGTDTGRLSSQNPNFQNLPAGRTKHAKAIKNMFQAEPGTVLIQADAKAAEVRWAANFCQDPTLVKVFRDSHDVLVKACESESVTDEEFQAAQLAADLHRRTASLMFNLSPGEVSGAMRQSAKSITFGLMFGMNVRTLAENNGWKIEEAEEKLEAYFSAFPKLRRWLDDIKRVAHRQGYVQTLMGRRRRLFRMFDTLVWRHQGDAERRAMNSPIQGQSSDAGVIALFLLNEYILEHNLERRWLVQNSVHDSVLVQVPREDVGKAVAVMRDRFEDGMAEYIQKWWKVNLLVPIEWEFELGLRYGDLHKWDGRPKTFTKILTQLDDDAKVLWKAKDEVRKPSSQLDLVKWAGK